MENTILSTDQIIDNFAYNFGKLCGDAQTIDAQILDQFRLLAGVPTLSKVNGKLKPVDAIPHFSNELLDQLVTALDENRGDKSEKSYHGQKVSYVRGLFHALAEGNRDMVLSAIEERKSLQTSYKALQKLKTEANGNGKNSGQTGNSGTSSETEASEDVQTSEDLKAMVSLVMPKDSDPESWANNLLKLLGDDVALAVAETILNSVAVEKAA